MKSSMLLRPLQDSDVSEYAELLYGAFNFWYWKHGWGKNFLNCHPQETAIYYQIYKDISPGCSVAVFDENNGRMMGVCFYHPREYHVSLGVMSVHPNYGGQGVGRQMINHILTYTREHDYDACRLVSSAGNMDSFSLYNRAGFVPYLSYQDMVITIPETSLGSIPIAGTDCVREANLSDIDQMGLLELEVSCIKREIDYRYAIENPRDIFHASVYVNHQQQVEGFMISVKHPALNMLGPCVARTEAIAIALIRQELERFNGSQVLILIPMDKRKIVEQMYTWKAINVETHLYEVWGKFTGFNGVNIPGFLPETG